MISLIDDYVDYATSATDAPPIYHKAVAYFVASSLLGRYVRIVTSYAPLGLMPNLWVILIGPSRITRKTTAMNLGTGIIEEVDANLLIPASFTPEALYEMLNNLRTGDAITWVKDEFGGFFKMLEKKYMAGVREILSALYMGQGETRKLRNLTLKIPRGLYTTAIGTMPTPPHYYLTDEDFTSGFLNRFVLAYALAREKRIPILHSDRTVESKRDALIKKYIEFTEHYENISPVPISFSHGALRMLEEYDVNIEKELLRIEREQPTSLYKLYLAESPNLFLKLAVLRRIAREPLSETLVVVDETDCIMAQNDLALFLNSAKQVIDDVQMSAHAKPVLTEEKRLDRVYNCIKTKGREGATLSEILLSTHYLKNELANILVTLVEQGKVIAVKKQSGGRGKRALVFYTQEHALVAQDAGQVLDTDTLEVLLKRR